MKKTIKMKSMNKFDSQLVHSLESHSINPSANSQKSKMKDFGVISESSPKSNKIKRSSNKSGKVNSISANEWFINKELS